MLGPAFVQGEAEQWPCFSSVSIPPPSLEVSFFFSFSPLGLFLSYFSVPFSVFLFVLFPL